MVSWSSLKERLLKKIISNYGILYKYADDDLKNKDLEQQNIKESLVYKAFEKDIYAVWYLTDDIGEYVTDHIDEFLDYFPKLIYFISDEDIVINAIDKNLDLYTELTKDIALSPNVIIKAKQKLAERKELEDVQRRQLELEQEKERQKKRELQLEKERKDREHQEFLKKMEIVEASLQKNIIEILIFKYSY